MSENREGQAPADATMAGCTGQVWQQGGTPVESTGTACPAFPQQQAAQPAQAPAVLGQGATLDPVLIAAHSAPQPPAISRSWDNIPEILRCRQQWCFSPPGTKAPHDAKTGKAASVTNSATWSTFDDACNAAHYTGGQIGFVMQTSDGFFCIDLDDKEDNPATEAEWQRFNHIIETFETWTELSVSGRGRHLWGLGTLRGSEGIRRDHVEIYCGLRYMLMTGNELPGYGLPMVERQDLLNLLFDEIRKGGDPIDHSGPAPDVQQTKTDDQLWQSIQGAANAAKFNRLFSGGWQGYESQSEADLALVQHVLFYGATNEQAVSIWNASVLSPAKRPREKRKSKPAYYINRTLSSARGIRAQEVQASLTAFAPALENLAREQAEKEAKANAMNAAIAQSQASLIIKSGA
ncbi:MAG: hypothetical protein KA535_03355 [Azonexus sp.]|nr:hypothetical protein [Azonexus sp.]